MITDPLFYLCAIPAVLLYGIAKGGFGGNIAILSVPLMAMVVVPQQAAAILLPILCAMDLVALRTFRGRWDKTNLRIILPAALVGIALGALTFRYLNDAHIKLLIGAIALLFTLNMALRRGNPEPRPASLWRGRLWGMVSGFTSFGIHAGGPPINVYMLPQRLEKTLLMGTIAVFFTVVNWVKVPAYVYLGQFSAENLLTSLVLLPLAPIGVKLGFWMLQRSNEQLIYRLCYLFLFFTGGKLFIEGVMGLVSA
ncbi:sulfite exporter TauE/SafE family protein [Halopseudomonas sabulinigri]|uniref:Probable membrane transporter protein n=1 Tax=Halopseudomonas sabulinigri TaxID=472181 RepID=A0ABP9ZQB1_9GAMM